MTAAATDPVMSAIRGAEMASAALQHVQLGCAPPDALHDALQAAIDTRDPDLLRAFARRCQKALEVTRSSV